MCSDTHMGGGGGGLKTSSRRLQLWKGLSDKQADVVAQNRAERIREVLVMFLLPGVERFMSNFCFFSSQHRVCWWVRLVLSMCCSGSSYFRTGVRLSRSIGDALGSICLIARLVWYNETLDMICRLSNISLHYLYRPVLISVATLHAQK